MITAALARRLSLPPDAVNACNAVGMTDSDVWHDVCTLFDATSASRSTAAAQLRDRCLDGADDDTAPAWIDYVSAVEVYTYTDRDILRPLADLDERDRNDTEITDVVGGDFRPVWEIPAWCEGVDTIGRAADTAGHGARAMALPCVFYAKALRVMSDHGNDVVQFLDRDGFYSDLQPLTLSPSSQNWCGFASHVLSIAVESWCGAFVDLDVADRYVVARVGRVYNDAKAGV